MATKTITIDTNEWIYPDISGAPHTVKNAETFTFTLTDGGAAAVTYQNDLDGSVLCDDGSRVFIRRWAVNATNGTGNGNTARTWGPTADAQDGVAIYGLAGEFVTSHSHTNTYQIWKAVSINVDNVDAPTTITARFEDQFGNAFSWTGVTIS